jgi:hypothetical protein
MLQTARLLNLKPSELYLLRLGLIAWMVPIEDHSLLEILMAAEDSGLPFPHNSNMYAVDALLPAQEAASVEPYFEEARVDMQENLEGLLQKFDVKLRDPVKGPGGECAYSKAS